MAYTISQNLNIKPKYFAPVVVHLSAGDSGIPITFSMYDGAYTYEIPSGAVISVQGTRKDGASWITTGTASGNEVTFTSPPAMAAVEGAGIAEVSITSGSETYGSANFLVLVERASIPNGVSYSSDPSVFQDILNYVKSGIAVGMAEASAGAVAEWLEENITPTTPAVDKSLTVSGAAADAKVVGDSLIDNGIIDIFEDGTYSNSTWRGVTLTWSGNVATITGTATDGNFNSPNIYYNATEMPANISAGDTVFFDLIQSTTNCILEIYAVINGSLSQVSWVRNSQEVLIPNNATGLLMRLLVLNGTTVNGNFEFQITKTPTVKSRNTILPIIHPNRDENLSDLINTTLEQCGKVILGKGTYVLKNPIIMPDNSTIEGAGEATIIQAGSGKNGIVAGANCYIQNVRIHSEDGHTDARGSGSGILVQGNHENQPLKYNVKIDNVTIDGFSLAGIHGIATGTWVADSITASNCRIFNCYAGILAEDYSEFGRYTNILCYNNYMGLLNMSGNNVFVNCSFSNNTVGVYLIGDEEPSGNNGHGTLVGCTINHSNNNQGFAVVCRGLDANGFVFDSCQIWYGKIQVENSTGITFNNCMLGAYNTNTEIINYTANDLFLMNCLFKVGATFSGSGGETHTINCFKFDGTPITA